MERLRRVRGLRRQLEPLLSEGGMAPVHHVERAVVAGPGNPPVVVDETACLKNAAESIVKGAAYDNNLLCIGEKQVFCVDSVFDKLMAQMEKAGGYVLDSRQIEALTKQAFKLDPKDFNSGVQIRSHSRPEGDREQPQDAGDALVVVEPGGTGRGLRLPHGISRHRRRAQATRRGERPAAPLSLSGKVRKRSS